MELEIVITVETEEPLGLKEALAVAAEGIAGVKSVRCPEIKSTQDTFWAEVERGFGVRKGGFG